MTSPISNDTNNIYVVKITRGATKHPERPISSSRFLIGAGSNCQLQLGGDTPMLHSVIVANNDELWIDAVVPTPALIVNGKQVRESLLAEGDLINIGSFSFEIGLRVVAQHNPIPRPITPAEIASTSASQLVDLLELELSEQQSQSKLQEFGATALLNAIKAAGKFETVEQSQQTIPAIPEEKSEKILHNEDQPPLRMTA